MEKNKEVQEKTLEIINIMNATNIELGLILGINQKSVYNKKNLINRNKFSEKDFYTIKSFYEEKLQQIIDITL